MKKSVIIVIALSGAVLFLGILKPNPAQKKYPPVPARQPEPQSGLRDPSAKDIRLKRAKVILESQDWIISLKPSAPGLPKEEDVLTFSEGRVISRNLFSKGYPQVRYSLSFSPQELVSWEAVQESPEAGISSWRGELKGESSMRGFLSLQNKDGRLEDFFFDSGGSDPALGPRREDSAAGQGWEKKRRKR